MELLKPKTKFPRRAALEVAREVVRLLEPRTERLIVAGSLRRRKAMVGDIEILFIPRFVPQPVINQADMFAPQTISMVNDSEAALHELIAAGLLAKRTNALGSFTWGDQNKLARHCASGVPVDFFVASVRTWWTLLVCRTGGAENNIAICNAAHRRGLKWHPYLGFTNEDGQLIQPESEAAVFEIVGLPHLDPWMRR